MIGCPAEGPEVVGQMLGREQLVCRLQGGAEIGDQGVDVEERRIALALRTFAAGDGGDVGASALAEDVESRRTVGVHQSAGGNVGIAEDGRFLVAEAADHRHGNGAHAATRMTLGGGDDTGFAGSATALVALTAEIDVVGLHDRRPAALGRRAQLGSPAEGGWAPIVEADDVYLGGERNEGRGTAGKTRVIAAAERHPSGRMGAVAMAVVSGFSNEEATIFRDAHIAPGALVHTDGTPAFHVFGEGGRTHVTTVTGGKRPQRERDAPFFNVNTLISNLSTALKATYKLFSPKHLPDYLGAFCWTTNHRRNMPGMIGALCSAAASSSRLTRRSVYA